MASCSCMFSGSSSCVVCACVAGLSGEACEADC